MSPPLGEGGWAAMPATPASLTLHVAWQVPHYRVRVRLARLAGALRNGQPRQQGHHLQASLLGSAYASAGLCVDKISRTACVPAGVYPLA